MLQVFCALDELYTCLYDEITERKMIKRNTKEALEDAIVELYKEKETAP